jgi:hypothetical protein
MNQPSANLQKSFLQVIVTNFITSKLYSFRTEFLNLIQWLSLFRETVYSLNRSSVNQKRNKQLCWSQSIIISAI